MLKAQNPVPNSGHTIVSFPAPETYRKQAREHRWAGYRITTLSHCRCRL